MCTGAGFAPIARRQPSNERPAAICQATRRAASDRRPTALVLVDGEVYPTLIQALQRALDPVLLDQPLEVAVLTAGEPQELLIRRLGVLEDRVLDQSQKVSLAAREPAGHRRPRLVEAD